MRRTKLWLRVLATAAASAVVTAAITSVWGLGRPDAPGLGPAPRASPTATTTPTDVASGVPDDASAIRPPTPAPASSPEGQSGPLDIAATPPPPATPFEPEPSEVYPNAKREAGRVAEQLTTYSAGQTASEVAAALGPHGTTPAELADAATPLFVAGASSTGAVVYAQLGGLAPPAVSVMVVVRQRLERPEGFEETTRTLDIRLRQEGDAWLFDSLESAGGDPVERPADLPPLAAQVVDDPRIELPDSARWDIFRGSVDQRVLETMAAMAERAPYTVAVLSTGHPPNVFGSDRLSNHTAGRGVDVYAVDGELVINQQTEESPAYALSRWLYEQGVEELGSPWVFTDLGVGRSFTDTVHADHLHVAFDG